MARADGVHGTRSLAHCIDSSAQRMALLEVFSHSDRFHYRARLLSLATCFLVLCTAFTFLPPFLFTYFAEGFWIKEATYTEQPRVNYSNCIVTVSYESTTTNRFFFSSYATLNAAYRDVYLPGTDVATASDTDADGINDQFNIAVELLPASSNVGIASINIWMIFQYELRARQTVTMETMAMISLPAPSSTTVPAKVTAVGELVLFQRQPIPSSGSDTTLNGSIFGSDSTLALSATNFNAVMENYFNRKYYTIYQPYSTNWGSGATQTITANVTVKVPRRPIRYIPGFWQEFKWGWIQYVSFLLPFAVVFHRIKEFVFRNQLVRTLVEMPRHRHKA